jgi:hypothetical protein
MSRWSITGWDSQSRNSGCPSTLMCQQTNRRNSLQKPRRRANARPNDQASGSPMPIYPIEFYRRSEQNWKRRAWVSRPYEGIPPAARGLHPKQERREILAQRPWLLAIGQGLQAEYNVLEQPVQAHLAALLKELDAPTKHH